MRGHLIVAILLMFGDTWGMPSSRQIDRISPTNFLDQSVEQSNSRPIRISETWPKLMARAASQGTPMEAAETQINDFWRNLGKDVERANKMQENDQETEVEAQQAEAEQESSDKIETVDAAEEKASTNDASTQTETGEKRDDLADVGFRFSGNRDGVPSSAPTYKLPPPPPYQPVTNPKEPNNGPPAVHPKIPQALYPQPPLTHYPSIMMTPEGIPVYVPTYPYTPYGFPQYYPTDYRYPQYAAYPGTVQKQQQPLLVQSTPNQQIIMRPSGHPKIASQPIPPPNPGQGYPPASDIPPEVGTRMQRASLQKQRHYALPTRRISN